jgi:stearoyl-CoA desaturase (Delta-9 desaturase)
MSVTRMAAEPALIAVVVPPLGLLAAMGALWNAAFRPLDLVLFLSFYIVCAFGITVGFHRFYAHRSFTAARPLQALLAILGSMTMQGPLTQWVADHRRHHAFSDQPGDPHSPHGHGAGIGGAIRGFLHAHVGWLFTSLGLAHGRRYAADLQDDPLVRTVDRFYLLWVALGFALPFAIAYGVGGGLRPAVEGLLWGGLIRVCAFQHATFSVNSICHLFGRQAYRSRDEARNNWLIAVLALGEGWHNNHHAFPASARHGLDRGQIDPSWWLIHALARARLVSAIKLPDATSRARRRLEQ